MPIRLNTHLKRLITKASVVGLTVGDIHNRIDEILGEYGVKNKLPQKHNQIIHDGGQKRCKAKTKNNVQKKLAP